jgi:hypothetical protein
MTVIHPPERSAARISKMLLAMLVLAIRLAAGLMPMSPAGAAASEWAGAVICHAADPADAAPHQAPAQPPGHHDHDCGVCPICHFLAASALPSGGAPAVSPTDLGAVEPPPTLPPPTGPPQTHRHAARPRAPPALSA